ncbi:MAG: DUF3348 family protein [Halioglobus sp.]
MAQTASQSPPNGARLVRFLSGLNLGKAETRPTPFTERLAQLIDLPDSILILDTHGKLSNMEFASVPVAGKSVQQLFLQTQAAIIESIVKSFSPNRELSRLKRPVPLDTAPSDAALTRDAYVKFYAAHQRQIDLKVQKLQAQVRDVASGLSPRLSQLAALDTVLGDTLSLYSRNALGVLPKLVAQRFDDTLNEYNAAQNRPPSPDAHWTPLLNRYLGELQEMLLAETETRLLPILGLIETINEDADHNEYE